MPEEDKKFGGYFVLDDSHVKTICLGMTRMQKEHSFIRECLLHLYILYTGYFDPVMQLLKAPIC